MLCNRGHCCKHAGWCGSSNSSYWADTNRDIWATPTGLTVVHQTDTIQKKFPSNSSHCIFLLPFRRAQRCQHCSLFCCKNDRQFTIYVISEDKSNIDKILHPALGWATTSTHYGASAGRILFCSSYIGGSEIMCELPSPNRKVINANGHTT